MAKISLFLVCVLICLCNCKSDGTWEVQNTSDRKVKELGELAIDKINEEDNTFSRLQKVTKAKKKVVRENIDEWKLMLIREQNDCPNDAETCETTKKEECKVSIIVGPAINDKEVKYTECHPQLLVGGISQVPNINDEDVLKAVEFAVSEYNRMSNNMYMLRPIETPVKKVTTQVVQGILYRIDLDLGKTECRNAKKNYRSSLKECPLIESAEVTNCFFTVWYKAWEQKQFTLIKPEDGKPPCSTTMKSNKKSSLNRMKREIRMHKQQNVDTVMDMGGLHYKKHHKMLGGDGHDYYHQQIMEDYTNFKTFVKKYNKIYADKKEHYRRFDIFRYNMKKVKEIQKMDKGSAKYGATKFADLTEAEFRKNYLTPKWNQAYDPRLKPAEIPQIQTPAAFDWRNHNAVTEVKNQGSCGSCWAFSTTGNIEGQWAIKKKKLISLSEQELVDCDKIDQGCGGGLPSNAYEAIMKLGGLETEKKYPYEGEGEKCAFIKSDVRVYINSSLNISSDEADMAAWLSQNGPISIGINAFAMQFYFGGISHPWKIFCNPEELDHGVLIVGYGTKDGEPYWIIKNSWGPDWGESGYYLVYRGSGVCGLNRMCTSAKVD